MIGEHTIKAGIPTASCTTNCRNPRGKIQVDRILKQLPTLDKTILGFMGMDLESWRSRPSRRRANLFVVTIIQGERPGFQGTPNNLASNYIGRKFFLGRENPKREIIIRVSRETTELGFLKVYRDHLEQTVPLEPKLCGVLHPYPGHYP